MGYGDMDETIREFFRASIDRTLDDFDFEEAFSYMESVIYQKLTEHGLTTFDDYLQNYDDLFGRSSQDGLEPYAFKGLYCYISVDELHEEILRYTQQKLMKCYGNMSEFVELRSLYDQMQNVHRLTTGEKAILFDAVIHAQHVTGDIFEEVDIEALKEEIDAEYS